MIYINALANLIIGISMVFFIIFIFGSNNQKIKALPKYESLFIKTGLSFIACGSILSFITLSNPQFTEVLMNCGLAFVFLWGAFFHYKHFIKK